MPKTNLKFDVIVDTNVLFSKDPTKIVGRRFDENWMQCCQTGEMRLIVPEVVMGERLYQMVSAAEKAVHNAKRNFETITKVSGGMIPKFPTIKEIKTGAEKRFQKWILESKAVVAQIPYQKIHWHNIVNDAIWRINPFVAAGENEDSEKGFRDKLILETVREFLHKQKENKTVFICQDAILRETVKEALGAKLFANHEELGGFVSYLKLTQENLGKQFTEKILAKSSTVFYSASNPECVYSKLNVHQLIIDQWGFLLDLMVPTSPPAIGAFDYLSTKTQSLQGLPTSLYLPASKEKIIIDGTDFNASTAQDRYEWKTHIRHLRIFKDINQKPLTGLEWLYETLRVAKFDVYWEALIDQNANFSKFSVTKILLSDQTTEPIFNAAAYGNFERLPAAPLST